MCLPHGRTAGLPETQIEESYGEADRTILTLMLEADARLDKLSMYSSGGEQITDNY
jgi:hypothetical protein